MSARAPLVLASASPRRLELLAQIGVVPDEALPPDVDETPLKDETPRLMVERLARAKAAAIVALRPGAYVLAADTTVDVDGEILSKPDDDEDAAAMLRRLQGRVHRVHTGVAVAHDDTTSLIAVTTVHKVSTLIMNVVTRLVDTQNNRTIWARDLSFRDDSDESWARAGRFLAGEIHDGLMTSLPMRAPS